MYKTESFSKWIHSNKGVPFFFYIFISLFNQRVFNNIENIIFPIIYCKVYGCIRVIC